MFGQGIKVFYEEIKIVFYKYLLSYFEAILLKQSHEFTKGIYTALCVTDLLPKLCLLY